MITEREILAIDRVVADRLGVSEADFIGRRKHVERVEARALAFWIAHRRHRASLPRIGRVFGRHHTTVLYAVRQVDDRMANDAGWRALAEGIEEMLARFGPLATEQRVLVAQIAKLHEAGEELRRVRRDLAAARAAARRARGRKLANLVAKILRRRKTPLVGKGDQPLTKSDLIVMNRRFCAAMRAAGYAELPQ